MSKIEKALYMKSVEVLVPKSLVQGLKPLAKAVPTKDGLVPLKVFWNKGIVSKIKLIKKDSKKLSKLLLPRFVEPHAHIDKAFCWDRFHNIEGNYNAALRANLDEHYQRKEKDVLLRATRSIKESINNGMRAVRTHVDSFGPVGFRSFEIIDDLKTQWQEMLELQIVALVPIEYWSTSDGQKLAKRVASSEGLLGGVLKPPFQKEETKKHIYKLIYLANELNCGIDLHIDESSSLPGAGLIALLDVLDKIKNYIPITCSHLSSTNLLNRRIIENFSERLFFHDINVIALPLTNYWLLNRDKRKFMAKRPLAPINELQKNGIDVAIGRDNVQDPWYPLGDFDPFMLMRVSMPITQIAPWTRIGLSPFTTAPSRILRLKWDGILSIGCPADFVIIKARSWVEALSNCHKKKVIIKGDLKSSI